MKTVINEMLTDGYDLKQIRDAFNDGEWLATQGYTQEQAEEADDILNKMIAEKK